MHELSVAQQLVELVVAELGDEAAARVRAVTLRLGALSGVASEALLSVYGAAAAGTPLRDSTLAIDPVAAAVFCRRCDREHELPGVQSLRCPACHSGDAHVTRGRELEVLSVEVAEDADPAGGG